MSRRDGLCIFFRIVTDNFYATVIVIFVYIKKCHELNSVFSSYMYDV